MSREEVLQKYKIEADGVSGDITIMKVPDEFTLVYQLKYPKLEPTTQAVLRAIREKVISEMNISPVEIMNIMEIEKLKKGFIEKSLKLIGEELPHMPKNKQKILAGILTHKSVGIGLLEFLLHDPNIEEIAVNSSKEPAWAYHVKFGWIKTNISLPSESEIYNYAALIGRRVGSQITNLNPLMDAYLTSGDRSNATLFPISTKGNTLTIRKFARRPWTITDFIKNKTISVEVAAFLWLSIQYEMNILIAGGTASGKTSMLNALSCFIPPNHRIISIEETRELQIPDFLHWVPLTTRPPNPEGKGEVTMLQLMINALRMRPDRVIFGEIRREKEAEVLFEAIHTGHSVYSTLHANTSEETLRRLTNPPIDIPSALLGSLQLVLVMHRDRRKEIRRVLELSELMPSSSGRNELKMELNTIYNWIPSKDSIMALNESTRVLNDIKLYTGMGDQELKKDLAEKIKILDWFVKNEINDIYKVAKIISEYYVKPGNITKRVGIRRKAGEVKAKKSFNKEK